MSHSPLGVAIVGFGGMGSEHARKIETIDCMRVIGSYDPEPTRQQAALALGYQTYPSLQAILDDPAIAIVLIATPNHVHKEIAIAALRAKKAVICEKPVTMNSDELKEIIAVANETGMLFTVHQNRRWDEDYLAIKQLYDDGSLGEITHIEQRIHGSRGIPGDWRQLPEYGGGMMLDWGVHLVDRILLMVKDKVKHVFCHLIHDDHQTVDDGFHLFIEFESGKTALMEVGTKNFINLPLWYITGTRGTALIQDWSMQGKIVHLEHDTGHDATPIIAGAGLTKTMAPRIDDSTIETPMIRLDTDVRDFYQNVADVLAGKAEKIVKDYEVLRVMLLLEAAMRSDANRQVVPFE